MPQGLKYKMRWFELSRDTLVYTATSESVRDVNAKIRVFGMHELVWAKKVKGAKFEVGASGQCWRPHSSSHACWMSNQKRLGSVSPAGTHPAPRARPLPDLPGTRVGTRWWMWQLLNPNSGSRPTPRCLQLKFPERVLVLRAQTSADAAEWLAAIDRARTAGGEQQGAQGGTLQVPAGLESLRKVGVPGWRPVVRMPGLSRAPRSCCYSAGRSGCLYDHRWH
jgi:hypothetical protein